MSEVAPGEVVDLVWQAAAEQFLAERDELRKEVERLVARVKEREEEIANLQERWACVDCGRTPDGGKSGDLYVSICHGCHRCMACAEPMCSICGDAEGVKQRAIDLRQENWRLREALEIPPVWPSEEILEVFTLAQRKHGLYESLFAVAAWTLRNAKSRAELVRLEVPDK